MNKASQFRLPPKSMAKIPDEIDNEITRLNREHKQRLRQFVRAIFDSAERGRWVAGCDLELKQGGYYYIRRVWEDGADTETCFAEWVHNAWRVVWNDPGRQPLSESVVEVWQWEEEVDG